MRRSLSLILFPAIDLKAGQCVRLKLGDMNQATVFNDDPAAQALLFAEAGAELVARYRRLAVGRHHHHQPHSRFCRCQRQP